MEDDQYEIGARIDEAIKKDDTFSKSDPFSGNWDTLKSLDGLDANFSVKNNVYAEPQTIVYVQAKDDAAIIKLLQKNKEKK